MNILYLAHRVPYPPNKGDKIRSFHEIRHFSRSHTIHLLAFCDQPGEERYSRVLEEHCRTVTLVPLRPWPQRIRATVSMFLGKPWTLGYFGSPAMRKTVRTVSGEHSFDLVFAYSSSMAPYARALPHTPKIVDFVDSDASKWEQYAKKVRTPSKWLYSYEGTRLKRFESELVREFDLSVFIAEREADHLRGTADRAKIHFIQNGIDLEYFSTTARNLHSKNVVFTGAMDYYPNIDAVTYFAREVLPEVRSAVPGARFFIVGSNPSSQVRLLSTLPGVVVTGTVRDVRPFLADAAVAVVPTRISQGLQNKILEALASGLPVVATSTALRGMEHRQDLPVAEADDAGTFAQRVIAFLNKPLSGIQIEACRQSLRKAYSWELNLSAFDGLFDRLAPAPLLV